MQARHRQVFFSRHKSTHLRAEYHVSYFPAADVSLLSHRDEISSDQRMMHRTRVGVTHLVVNPLPLSDSVRQQKTVF